MGPLHVSLMRVREHALRLSIAIADWEQANPQTPAVRVHEPLKRRVRDLKRRVQVVRRALR